MFTTLTIYNQYLNLKHSIVIIHQPSIIINIFYISLPYYITTILYTIYY